MHYYVVGVNGSGKTSLLTAISDKTGIDAVHGTTVLMKDLRIPGDYSALRAMDQAEVLRKWGETATKLVTDYGSESFLLDTHIMNLTNGNMLRRDGDWIANYDALILVKADPAVILSRVEQDSNKDRALFAPNTSREQKLTLLAHYQEETEKLFNQLCKKYHLPSLIIENNGTIEQGVDVFIRSRMHEKATQ